MKIKKNFWNSVNFVRPLYKKIRQKNQTTVKRSHVLDLNSGHRDKQVGHGKSFKRHIYNRRILFKSKSTNCVNLPGICENVNKKDKNMIIDIVSNLQDPLDVNKRDKIVQINGGDVNAPMNHNAWLRVYPAPQLLGEALWSVVFRCLACQLGLIAFLLLWTMVWTFVIYYFEEPNEREVSKEFRTKQTQLVIDLATELRQITPLSSKWRQAIENRIEKERHLTEVAVAKGARHDPGRFWDLSGSLLFNVYIMTAMGFGAPVPHTVYGRTSAVIYAAVAIPIHVYLMVNASQCIVVNFEKIFRKLKSECGSVNSSTGKSSQRFENDTNGKNSSDPKMNHTIRKNVSKIARNVVGYGQGIFIAIIGYYVIGTLLFGYLRGRDIVDTIMFPMQFTTTGGLEMIEGYLRVAYAVYLEGAMLLLSCALAILRKRSSEKIDKFTQKYRLFNVDPLLKSKY